MAAPFPINLARRGSLRARAESLKAALLAAKWAATRVFFIAYVGFALFTVVGGFLTAPLATWYFFGDWRFWRHWGPGVKLFRQGYRVLGLMLRGESGFMLDVPLAAPPLSAPAPSRVKLNPDWDYGSECGECSRCCAKIGCPIHDPETGFCRGYDAFYWRYFNCGRFPSNQREIDYYGCQKWLMREGFVASTEPKPAPVASKVPGGRPAGGAARGGPAGHLVRGRTDSLTGISNCDSDGHRP
jgi:hypothetical protein